MENKGTISITSSSARKVSSSGVKLGCKIFGSAMVSRCSFFPARYYEFSRLARIYGRYKIDCGRNVMSVDEIDASCYL